MRLGWGHGGLAPKQSVLPCRPPATSMHLRAATCWAASRCFLPSLWLGFPILKGGVGDSTFL